MANSRHTALGAAIAEPASPVTREEVDALTVRLAAVEAELAEWRAATTPPDDAALLQILAVSTKGLAFTARELREHARVDADLARVLSSLSVKRVGKLLRRLMDRELGGLVLRQCGRIGAGVLWMVQVVAHTSTR
jgi:hypothetical protein